MNAEISTDVVSNSSARKRAVALCLDHVVHRKSSGLYCECNVQLEYEGVATFLC